MCADGDIHAAQDEQEYCDERNNSHSSLLQDVHDIPFTPQQSAARLVVVLGGGEPGADERHDEPDAEAGKDHRSPSEDGSADDVQHGGERCTDDGADTPTKGVTSIIGDEFTTLQRSDAIRHLLEVLIGRLEVVCRGRLDGVPVAVTSQEGPQPAQDAGGDCVSVAGGWLLDRVVGRRGVVFGLGFSRLLWWYGRLALLGGGGRRRRRSGGGVGLQLIEPRHRLLDLFVDLLWVLLGAVISEVVQLAPQSGDSVLELVDGLRRVLDLVELGADSVQDLCSVLQHFLSVCSDQVSVEDDGPGCGSELAGHDISLRRSVWVPTVGEFTCCSPAGSIHYMNAYPLLVINREQNYSCTRAATAAIKCRIMRHLVAAVEALVQSVIA